MDRTSPERSGAERTRSVGELLVAAHEGDQAAWDDLVERFLPLVSGVIGRHRLRGADAEDVNQTVWLRLVEHLGRIREPEALPGWLATTTRHECLALLRRSRRLSPVDPAATPSFDLAGEQPDPAEDLLREERHHALRTALQELSEGRRALLLMLLEDPPRPYAEISRILGIPVGSIGPTRARALERLRGATALHALLPVHDAAS